MNTETIIEAERGAIAAVRKLPPDEAKNKARADALVKLAEGIQINTPEDYEFAATELRVIIGFHNQLEEERTSFTKPLNEVLNRLNERFMPYLKALRGDGKKGTVSAESIIKDKMAAFTAEQERQAAEARRKAEAEAQAERDRIAAEAEAVRKKAEAARLEAERVERVRQAEAAAAQKALDDAAASARSAKARKEAEARAEAQRVENERIANEQAEQRRQAEERAEQEADALETTAAVITAQPVAAPVVRVAGISKRTVIDCEVVDKTLLLQHILTSRMDLLELVTFDETKLKAVARIAGTRTAIPGLHVFDKASVTVR